MPSDSHLIVVIVGHSFGSLPHSCKDAASQQISHTDLRVVHRGEQVLCPGLGKPLCLCQQTRAQHELSRLVLAGQKLPADGQRNARDRSPALSGIQRIAGSMQVMQRLSRSDLGPGQPGFARIRGLLGLGSAAMFDTAPASLRGCSLHGTTTRQDDPDAQSQPDQSNFEGRDCYTKPATRKHQRSPAGLRPPVTAQSTISSLPSQSW